MIESAHSGVNYAPDNGGSGGKPESPKQSLKWGGVFRRLIQPLTAETSPENATLFDLEVTRLLQTLNPEAVSRIRTTVKDLTVEFGNVISEPEKVEFEASKVLDIEHDHPLNMPILRNSRIGIIPTQIDVIRAQAFVIQGGKKFRDNGTLSIPDLQITIEDVVPVEIQEFINRRCQIETALEDHRLWGEDILIAQEAVKKYKGIWATRFKIDFGSAFKSDISIEFLMACSVRILRMADDKGDGDGIIVQYGFGKNIITPEIVLSSSGLGNIQPLSDLEKKLTKIYNQKDFLEALLRG